MSPVSIYSILSSERRSGSGPGALNPPEILAPFGRTCERSKATLRPAYSGYLPPSSKNEDIRTSKDVAHPSTESSTT